MTRILAAIAAAIALSFTVSAPADAAVPVRHKVATKPLTVDCSLQHGGVTGGKWAGFRCA